MWAGCAPCRYRVARVRPVTRASVLRCNDRLWTVLRALQASPGLSMTDSAHSSTQTGTAGEVLRAFARLGLTSFGGPVAHLGYFRDELVLRRRWLGEREYAEVVALCQFLPGPTSSQVGWMLGLLRGGLLGALAAWAAFTLPSVVALLAFAAGAAALDNPFGTGLVHGLSLIHI